MKKKIILINLIILLSFTAHSQDSIKFTISGNNITNNYNKSKQYTLPLKFIFTEDFKNKEIEIYNPNVNEAFIFKAKCGDSKSLQANTDEQYIDDRSTLLWIPDLKFDEKGNSTINFYTSDLPGEYLIITEGIDFKGNPISSIKNFYVE